MEKDFNSSINLCASVLEKLKVMENESESDLLVVNDLQLPQGDQVNLQSYEVSNLCDNVGDSEIRLDIPGYILTNDINEGELSLDNFNESGGSPKEAALQNVFLRQFVDDHIDIDKPVKKFHFLKKGQGTARYGSKKLIGFKKANAKTKHKDVTDNSVPSESLKNFEKLEELVEHSSFISTSSQINALLQANDTLSSTPIRDKSYPKKSNLQNKFQLCHKLSRNKELVNELKEPSCKTETCNSLSGQTSSLLKSKAEYICNANGKTSHKTSKVHFPEQGVQVLEYENESLNDSTGISLEDSDLVTFSDLEGLVDFNMQNLIQSFPKESDKSGRLVESNKENIIPNLPKYPEDVKSLKMLLTSKIQYLNKEIKAFRDINDYLQVLTEELKEEKQNCIDIQQESETKLRNCTCGRENALSQKIKVKGQNNTDQKFISEQLSELLSSMRSVDIDIKDIQQNMPQKPKPKPFCNLKLISKPGNVAPLSNPEKIVQKKELAKPRPVKTNLTKHFNESVMAKHIEAEDDDSSLPDVESNQTPTWLQDKNDKDLRGSNKGNNYADFSHPKGNGIEFQTGRKIFQPLPNSVSEKSTDNFSDVVRSTEPSVLWNFHQSSNYKMYNDKVVYFFPNETTITKYNDGKEVRNFGNGQKETYFTDASYEVAYADNSMRSVYSDGTDIFVAVDGTSKTIRADGSMSIQFPNGQREDHIDGKVQRSYPDGTIKILYPNGKQETRYANGKIRIKDCHGNII